MLEREISTEIVFDVVKNGTVIEEYLDDWPCPSVLLLGNINNEYYHLVIGNCTDHARIITLYRPNEKKWIDYRFRKSDKNET